MTLIEAFARYVERSLSRHPMRGRVRIAVSSDEYRAIEADMRARGYAWSGVVSGVQFTRESGRGTPMFVGGGEVAAQVTTSIEKLDPEMSPPAPFEWSADHDRRGGLSVGDLEIPPEEVQAALEEAVEDLKENAEDLFEARPPDPPARAPMNHRGGRRRG